MRVHDPQLHYELIECRARPARVAVLIDSSDIDWRHTAVRIIEFFSSVWGGKHNIIVPTDGLAIDPTFWAILERFSPDYVYLYRKTGADIKVSHPERYAGKLQEQIDKYPDGFPMLAVERERIDGELQGAWADSFHLGPDLCSQIADRLVPFHFQKHFDPVVSNGYVPSELTSILEVLRYVDHSQLFGTFELPPEINDIWWTAHTGKHSKAFTQQLRGLTLVEQTIPVLTEDVDGFASWIVSGRINSGSSKINELLGGKRGFAPPDPTCPAPFDISMSCVGMYGLLSLSREFTSAGSLRVGFPRMWLAVGDSNR